MTLSKTLWLGAAAFAIGVAGQAHAGLYAADNLTDGSLNGVVKFDSNLTVQGSFLTTGQVSGITLDATSVYVSVPSGITKLDPNGTQLGHYQNIGVDHFAALAFGNNTLLAADNLTDGSLNGVVLFNSSLNVIGSFTTATPLAGLATDGTNIFASLTTGIVEYSFSGAILDTYSNVGVDRFGALSFAGGVLYAADNLTDNSLNGIVKFNGSLDVVGSFLTTGAVAGLAADGTNVYASLPGGVSKYTSAGALVTTYNNVGVDKFGALALTPNAAVPEPASWAMMIAGFGLVGGAARRSRKSFACAA